MSLQCNPCSKSLKHLGEENDSELGSARPRFAGVSCPSLGHRKANASEDAFRAQLFATGLQAKANTH